MEMIQRKDKAEEHTSKHCKNNEKEKRRKNRAQNGAETEDQYDEQTVTKEKIKKKKKKREEEQKNEAEDQYDEQTVTKDTIKKKKKKKREEEEQKNEAETEDQYDKQTVNKDKIKKKKKKRKEEERTENLEQSAKKEEEQVNEEEEKEETTVSIAVAGSIINNAQSFELATRLAGQIARAATIFRIDEVIVFDCKADTGVTSNVSIWDDEEKNESGALFLARILEYLDMPQYLRRTLIPRHNDLRHAGLLPPLDAPHHARKHEWVLYREGVTLDGQPPAGYGTYVDVGLTKAVFIQQTMKPQIRVTVAMGSNKSLDDDCVRQAVKRSEPKRKLGVYWGYTVRYASNIVDAFKECPYKGGYDYSIGTSEHGDIVRSADLVIPKFRHLLIAFGGLRGLEENIEKDVNLKGTNVRQLFNCYLNTCPNQGSRTIRTEEATFISLQYFQDPIQRASSSARIQ